MFVGSLANSSPSAVTSHCENLEIATQKQILLRGHTLITLALKGTYLVCKMLTTVL